MPSLRELLEVPFGLPADLSDDGETVLVQWNATGTMQLYREPWGGGELERLTDFAEPVNGLLVPGSGRILLQRDEGGTERHQLFLLDARPGAEPEPLVVEPDFLHVTPRLTDDGRLLAYACNRRNGVDLDVYVRELASGEERCVFAPGGYCELGGFSPDGRRLTVLRLTDRTGDNDLHVLDLETGEETLVAPEEEDAIFETPVWLPDGEAFLFPTSAGRDTVGIARYEVATGKWGYVLEDAWDLDCRLDGSGSTLAVHANEEGASRLELRDPRTLELRRELELPGRGVVEGIRLSGDGRRIAYGFSSPAIPWSVWLADAETGETRRLTPPSATVDEATLVEPAVERYASFDGESIPLFLFLPPRVEAPPLVVEIHGGPEAQRKLMWIPLVQYLVQSGYAVAQPNVRGSTGYGKRFEHLDDGRLRLDSVRDLAALHERLREDGRVDVGRAVLYGGSYGGYMTLAGLAFQPELWAAGIAVVPVSSFVTFLENTSAYRRALREREYGSLEHDREFLHEVSPLTHIERMRAPLFLIHGANDPRVPLGEAEQIHRVLRERGIRTELLVYGDEGHGLNKLANRLDAYPKAVAFLEEVLA